MDPLAGWAIPAVNLRGVNAGALTAGPRFASEGGAVPVSNFQIAILRGGDASVGGAGSVVGLLCGSVDLHGGLRELWRSWIFRRTYAMAWTSGRAAGTSRW